jgi:hypothetical protein
MRKIDKEIENWLDVEVDIAISAAFTTFSFKYYLCGTREDITLQSQTHPRIKYFFRRLFNHP